MQKWHQKGDRYDISSKSVNSKFQVLYIHVLILVPEKSDDTIVPKEPNPAVPDDLLKEVSQWTSEGVTEDDVIDRLRCRTVPSGYAFSSWTKGP